MVRKFLWNAILLFLMLCFFFPVNAAASRVEATLGWHNLMDDFYLVVEGSDPLFSDEDTIRGKRLKNSVLSPRGGIDPTDLHLGSSEFEMWSVDTSRRFDKWINKKTRKRLKAAAKQQQIFETGDIEGWKEDHYLDWKDIWKGNDADEEIDLWTLYEENRFIQEAFDKLEGKKIKGRIGSIKFKAYVSIFENPISNENPIPEPATMVLFGFGLLGLAGVSRKINTIK